MTDALEEAIIAGACRALDRRATALRKRAANFTTEIEHRGRKIMVCEPEALIAGGTAQLLEECATEIRRQTNV